MHLASGTVYHYGYMQSRIFCEILGLRIAIVINNSNLYTHTASCTMSYCASNWRKTNWRMPPLRKYSASRGVSIRTRAANSTGSASSRWAVT
jgi:hypothetical protein